MTIPGTPLTSRPGTELATVPGTPLDALPGTPLTNVPGTLLLDTRQTDSESEPTTTAPTAEAPPPNQAVAYPEPNLKTSWLPKQLIVERHMGGRQPEQLVEAPESGGKEAVQLESGLEEKTFAAVQKEEPGLTVWNDPVSRVTTGQESSIRATDIGPTVGLRKKDPGLGVPTGASGDSATVVSGLHQGCRTGPPAGEPDSGVPWNWVPGYVVLPGPPAIVRTHRNEWDGVISNPGMGVQVPLSAYPVTYTPAAAGTPGAILPSQTIYERFFWSEIQPTSQTSFDWRAMDAVLAATCSQNARLSFRVQPFWAGTAPLPAVAARNGVPLSKVTQLYGVPPWMASFPGRTATFPGTGTTEYVPYVGKHYRYAALELARQVTKRFGDDPNVDFIDVGLFGNSGEWATPVRYYWSSTVATAETSAGFPSGSFGKTITDVGNEFRPTKAPAMVNARSLGPRTVRDQGTKLQAVDQQGSLFVSAGPGPALDPPADAYGLRMDHWGDWGRTSGATDLRLVAAEVDNSYFFNSRGPERARLRPVALEIDGNAIDSSNWFVAPGTKNAAWTFAQIVNLTDPLIS